MFSLHTPLSLWGSTDAAGLRTTAGALGRRAGLTDPGTEDSPWETSQSAEGDALPFPAVPPMGCGSWEGFSLGYWDIERTTT